MPTRRVSGSNGSARDPPSCGSTSSGGERDGPTSRRIPQYWIIEHTPAPSVQVLTLDGTAYTAAPAVTQGTLLEAVIDADKPLTVSFDPAELLDF